MGLGAEELVDRAASELAPAAEALGNMHHTLAEVIDAGAAAHAEADAGIAARGKALFSDVSESEGKSAASGGTETRPGELGSVGSDPGGNVGVGDESADEDPYAGLKRWSNLRPNDEIFPDVPVLGPEELSRATGKFAYVVMPDGEIRATRLGGKWGHIDLANGEDTIAAGEAKLYAGHVKDIDNRSGHYQPVGSDPQAAVETAFPAAGIDVAGKYKSRWQ